MCSSFTQTFFCLFLLVGTALAIASLLSPAWTRYSLTDGRHAAESGDYSLGLVTALCGESQDCLDSFERKMLWEKTAIFCMVGAICACFGAMAWTCVMCFTCCCKSCLAPPLPVLTGLATILMAIGVTVYGVMSKQDFDITKVPQNLSAFLEGDSTFGYSMWLGVASTACLLIDTILGMVLVKIYDGYSPSPV